MARKQGSQNKPKEVLYTITCPNCGTSFKTSIKGMTLMYHCTKGK